MPTSTLIEFTVAVHFSTDIPLSIIDMADWVKLFEPEFPIFQQQPGLGRLEVNSAAFQLVPTPNLPMLALKTSSNKLSLKFQSDRIAFGWSRVTEPGTPDDYPGYDNMIRSWKDNLSKFEKWRFEKFSGTQYARLVEISYNNVIPSSESKLINLYETFSFMKKMQRKVNGFQVSWVEFLTQAPDSARVTATGGSALLPDGRRGIGYNFLGLAPVSGEILGGEVTSAIDALHARILDMHRAAIISDNV